MSLKLVSLSTTAINNKHASHRTCFGLFASQYIRLTYRLPCLGCECWRPITSFIQNKSISPNSTVAGDMGQSATGTDQQKSFILRLKRCAKAGSELKAHKVTLKRQTKCSLCCFSDTVLLCFGRCKRLSGSESKSKWSC